MKIISLVGSPHKGKGNTARLARLVLDGAESEGATTEAIYLPGKTVLPCLGCASCYDKGVCVQKDSFESIRRKIVEADGLVLGSPNYIYNVSSQLKMFMDRCATILHCLSFEGKYGASVVTSGTGGEEPITEYMNRFLIMTGIRPVGAVWATMSLVSGAEFPEQISTKAVELGKKIVRSWRDKAIDPETEKKMDQFKEVMHSRILRRGKECRYELEYWKEHRGLHV